MRQESQMRNLGGDKKHGGRVWASCHAGATADAGGCLHRKICVMLRYRQRVGLGRRTGSSRDISAGFDKMIKSAAIHGKVLNYRESARPERFNPDRVPAFELPHVKLAGGPCLARSMRNAVDDKGTHPANPFPAI